MTEPELVALIGRLLARPRSYVTEPDTGNCVTGECEIESKDNLMLVKVPDGSRFTVIVHRHITPHELQLTLKPGEEPG